MAQRVAAFLGEARRSLDLALYDVRLPDEPGDIVAAALLRGLVDCTQMEQVVHQWRTNGRSAWKIPNMASVLEHADFRGKPSTRWTPESLHDFMHAKVTVADDRVFAGSFNLSRSGEQNAENVLELHNAKLADRLAAFIDDVRERYPRMPAPR